MFTSIFDQNSVPLFKNKWNLSYSYFDLMRGLSALAVLLNHCHQFLFIPQRDLTLLSPVLANFYFFSSFGREAVVVFFVLSGFFISSSVLRSWKDRQWSWQDYLLRRMTRLYIVLIPALLLTVFWDRLGLGLFNTANIYQGINAPGIHVEQRLSLSLWLSNFLFFQGISWPLFSPDLVPTFGSNAPLWSLSYEFWYYLLFPIGLHIFSPKTHLKTRAIYVALWLGMLLIIGPSIVRYFLVWLLGVAISFARPLAFFNSPKRVNAFILVMLSLFISTAWLLHRMPPDFSFPRDFILGAVFAGLMYALLHKQENKKDTLRERLSEKLAGFSYTLYLVHYPPLFFFHAWLSSTGKWLPGYDQFGLLIITFLSLLMYAYGISRLTEAKTTALYQKLHQWMSKLRLRPDY